MTKTVYYVTKDIRLSDTSLTHKLSLLFHRTSGQREFISDEHCPDKNMLPGRPCLHCSLSLHTLERVAYVQSEQLIFENCAPFLVWIGSFSTHIILLVSQDLGPAPRDPWPLPLTLVGFAPVQTFPHTPFLVVSSRRLFQAFIALSSYAYLLQKLLYQPASASALVSS